MHSLLLEYRAVVSRVRHAIHSRGLLVMDAFALFDRSKRGFVTYAGLYGGLS